MVWIFVRLEFVTLLPKPARVPHRRDRFLPRRSLLRLPPRSLPNSAHFACSSRVAIPLTTHADFGIRCTCCVIAAGATRLVCSGTAPILLVAGFMSITPVASPVRAAQDADSLTTEGNEGNQNQKLTFDLFVSFCSNSKLPSSILDYLLALCISHSALAFQPQLANDRRTTGRTVLSRYRKHRVPETE